MPLEALSGSISARRGWLDLLPHRVVAFAVILYPEVMFAPLFSANDGDFLSARIDAVFDKLGDRFERIVLREGDDIDRVPMIADTELASRS